MLKDELAVCDTLSSQGVTNRLGLVVVENLKLMVAAPPLAAPGRQPPLYYWAKEPAREW